VEASTGLIATLAGTGSAGYSGDGGPAELAMLNNPTGVAVDASGNVFITDQRNHRVRRIERATGKIATAAGTGAVGFGGDGGPALAALLSVPTALAVDRSGHVFVSELGNLRVRKLTPVGGQGPAAPAITLTFDGTLRDRVGRGDFGIGDDSLVDGVFTVTLQPGSGERTVTSLELSRSSGGRWNTVPSDGFWILGAASSLDAPLYNNSTGAVNITVPEGGSFLLFAGEDQDLFSPGSSFTLTVGFADGSTATASVTIPEAPGSNRPPVATANRLAASVDAADHTGATVRLDASGSTDPDGDSLSFSWTDNGTVIATTAVAEVKLGVGAHSIVLTVSDGRGGASSTTAQSVTVNPPAQPGALRIDSVSPNTARRGATVTVTIKGAGFTPQSIVSISGGSITVRTSFVSSTQLNVTFTIAGNATTAPRSVSVINQGSVAVTLANAFTVRP
jgi:hypothetical protein